MSEHKLSFRTVASGAGLGECLCGWKSRVADDGHPEYTKTDIERDFERHCDRTILARVDREDI